MQDGNTVQFLSVAGKVLTCPELTRVTMVESVVTQGLKPARIRMGAMALHQEALYRNDDHDEIQGQIDRLAYGPEERQNAVRDPGTFVFRMEIAFKLNQVAYPVIVCGVSDRGRSFHLLALFITSQRLESLYVKALSSIRKVFTAGTGQQLLVKYVMDNTEVDQPNAVNQGFGVDSDYTYLMCLYRVMTKVHEKLKGIPDSLCEVWSLISTTSFRVFKGSV
ncbi:hypothetical protein F444_20785 [Phytophthora nicotianae P1976]|uniref:MULE transposase domain-containing protein n=1 Tax=Phytophthora nicotianae P1976 TaxID=1317066 RepID=A0A080Z3F4_PHYNI|nr:hypothetical protein F444_20785 [Phytophthora nicotianae P1976]